MNNFDKKYYKKYVEPNLAAEEDEIIEDLMSFPVRDITKNKKIVDYLKKHKVYLTLTSSPKRLRKASTALALVLQNPHIHRVYLVLPERYRNKEVYRQADIKFIEEMDPRIVIKRIKTDEGPITKMLPTLQDIRDKDAIVISMDDDVGYPASLINELIYYSVMYPDTIFTGAGFSWGDDRYPESTIDRKWWPISRKPRYPYVDIVEGWGMIAYKKRLVDLKRLKQLMINKDCILSDDLIISYMLAEADVPRKVIVNRYYDDQYDLYSFDYGLQEDALHRGAGLDSQVDNANIIKYKRCLKDLNLVVS